jgi:hypothetical protein
MRPTHGSMRSHSLGDDMGARQQRTSGAVVSRTLI